MTPTDAVLAQWRVLKAEWDDALLAYDLDDSDINNIAERSAWDLLVDFVEDNDLNYTEYDPRGPEEQA